ncbi:hypothetical protein Taro_009488 [Colocasia esculenta]|uniref:Uncharacterized protein n=1 Tax=Colocasia esculenta TaxID=4460 RepID=A0A843TWH8_COLES|nr:hypothetical protein [Colocasia esculenta]
MLCKLDLGTSSLEHIVCVVSLRV